MVHMPSSNLTPTISFEPMFRMFIINGYYTKSKLLVAFILNGERAQSNFEIKNVSLNSQI